MDNRGGRQGEPDDERWAALFADVEGELAAADVQELADEVAERTRAERATVSLDDRLVAAVGQPLRVSLGGGEAVAGRLVDAGPGWAQLEADDGTGWLVVTSAALWVAGAGSEAPPPAPLAGLSLPAALRRLARERAPVRLLLRDGSHVVGTLDEVLADGVVLAEHDPGFARREADVRRRLLLPLAALVAVRSGSASRAAAD